MPSLFGPGRFHGAVERRREVAGFTLTETVYPGEGALPPHRHEHGRLELVLRGFYRETVDEVIREREPMTLSVHPPGECHARRIEAGTLRLFNVEFGTEWLDRARRLWGVTAPAAEIRTGPLPGLMRRLHREFEREDRVSLTAIEGLLVHALTRAASEWEPAERGAPAWLEPVLEMIHTRYQRPLSVTALATCGGVRRQTLGSVFRRVYGCGLREYLMRVRVDHARGRLSDTDQPLADIASACGFCDQSHFTAVFRRLTGATPSRYREQARAEADETAPAVPALRLHALPASVADPVGIRRSASALPAARDTTG